MATGGPKLTQKDYLKKYLSGGAEGKKKKKKKPKGGEGVLKPKVRVIDDDVDVSKMQALDDSALDLYEMNEDAPQVCGIVDERPAELQALEQYKQSQRWKVLGNSDGDGVSVSAVGGGPKQVYQVPSDEEDVFAIRPQIEDRKKNKPSKDSSPPRRKGHESDESPPRRRKQNDSDESPPRKKKNYDSDASPPRKKKNYDSDASPPRRKSQRDSPPRKGRRYDSDESPPRSKHQQKQPDKHSSKRREQGDSDASPPRRRQQDISSSRRKHNDSDESPPRKKRQNDSDTSPPRRKRQDSDTSPPRRKRRDSDASPPRKRQQDNMEKSRRKNQSDSDTSPPRRPSSKRDTQDFSRVKIKQEKDDLCPKDTKMKKTLDGKKAGLQDAKNLKQELQEFKQREERAFAKMDDSLSGRGAVAVQRDRKTGLRRDLEAEQEEQRIKDEKDNKHKAKYTRWGKGVKQTEDQQHRLENDLYEMSKPLARYADDADLDTYLKDQDREGDPMLEYLQNKKKEQSKNKLPVYQGAFPPNRYNIRPGYRWDGVDRSCGYEKKWFEAKNAKKAVEEEAYKWSTSDM